MKQSLKHIITWILYSLFLFVIFSLVANTASALLRTGTIIGIQAIVFYANIKWILPLFYELKKYVIYFLLNFIFIILAVVIGNYGTKFKSHDDYSEGLHHSEGLAVFNLETVFTLAMPVLLVIFISFFFYTFQKRKQQEKKDLSIVTAEKNFLIQQINPHFLFNTLNNIYFLTYKTAPKGAQAIMQLSKMLDYSLYGEKGGEVTLKDEIMYINNFIALFKLKDSEIKNITFDYSKAVTSQKIAPMLLLPFIENAFKHGNIEDLNNRFIRIVISSEGNNFSFQCSNSFTEKKVVDKTGGIGITNVTRRLELLYPNTHQLNVNATNNQHLVSLKIIRNV